MKDFDKIVAKRIIKEKTPKKKKYYSYYNDKYRVRFRFMFPLVLIVKAISDYENNTYNALEWNEETAKKVLNKIFPNACEIDNDELCFNRKWKGTLEHHAHGKTKKFCAKFRYKLIDYIEKDYQIDTYSKRIEDCGYGEVWTIFSKKRLTN